VVRHIFQACPVWIYTQSNITSIMQRYVSVFKAAIFYVKWDIPLCRSGRFINSHVVIATVAAGGLINKLKWQIRGDKFIKILNFYKFFLLALPTRAGSPQQHNFT
jgi:hypothetical protein